MISGYGNLENFCIYFMKKGGKLSGKFLSFSKPAAILVALVMVVIMFLVWATRVSNGYFTQRFGVCVKFGHQHCFLQKCQDNSK